VTEVPERWRFSFNDDEVSLRDLTWSQAVHLFREAGAGDLNGQSEGECVSLEFNATHAAVLYMGRDGVILRPYFPRRPAAAQDLGPFFCGFFCGSCGIRLGDQDEFLARFLLSRAEGFRLFAAVLGGTSLPSALPDPHPGQPVLPGLEEAVAELAAGRVLEWRPLPSGEARHDEQALAPERGGS
jgi:hypothetical protein